MNGTRFLTQTIYQQNSLAYFHITSHITLSYGMRFIMNIEYHKKWWFDIFYETLVHYKY